MGFTKKQRREQKKQHAKQVSYPKRRRTPPQELPIDQPAPGCQQVSPPMALLKVSWTDPGGDLHQDVQLVELPAGYSRERLRLEILDQLETHGRRDCAVEVFDPDNVPPGSIPDGSPVTFNDQPLNTWQ